MPRLISFLLFHVTNILALLRHHVVMTQNKRILKAEVANLEDSFQNAISLSVAESSRQAKQIRKLEESVQEIKTSKTAAVEEAKKEKLSSEDA